MTSQPEDTPTCDNGHGYMVPMETEFCFAPVEGLVTVIVDWRSHENEIVSMGYAISDEARALLPSGPKMGDEIVSLQDAGKLVSIYDVMDAGTGYMRIDDSREGHNWSYLIWLGEERKSGVSLIPETVYHFFDYEPEEHRFPALETFDEVVALMSLPNTLLITEISPSLAHQNTGSSEVQSTWDLHDRVVVWDRGAIVRNARTRKAQETHDS